MTTKTEAKHTPGPWKFLPESIGPMPIWAYCQNSAGREVRQVVATVGATYNHLDVTLYGEQNLREVSDARLIAAAPETAAERDRLMEVNAELLAACQRVLTYLECLQASKLRDEIETQVRAAIARAEVRP